MSCFGNLDPGGLADRALQIIFFAASCVVINVGLLLSILLVGLLPAYLYGYFVFTKKSKISTWRGRLHGVAAIVMTLILSGILWVSAIVLGAWG